jgi:hypothetical protein
MNTIDHFISADDAPLTIKQYQVSVSQVATSVPGGNFLPSPTQHFLRREHSRRLAKTIFVAIPQNSRPIPQYSGFAYR